MTARKGHISVNTNDIFPIIKKWLYSEHDIFIRELVSNACDAITKRTTLGRSIGQEIPAGEVKGESLTSTSYLFLWVLKFLCSKGEVKRFINAPYYVGINPPYSFKRLLDNLMNKKLDSFKYFKR